MLNYPKVLFPICSLPVPHAPDVDFVLFDSGKPIPTQHRDADVLVIWEIPPRRVPMLVEQLSNLSIVQLLAAGTDHVPQMGLPRDVCVLRGVGLQDETVAEHALALTLAGLRGVNDLVRAQIGRRWAWEWNGVRQIDDPAKLVSLKNANVLILGYGKIGGELARLLRAFGANVTGIASKPRDRDQVRVYGPEQMWNYLPSTDVLISVLPSTPSTQGLIDRSVFSVLPRHAWFVNVGRGSVVKETDLYKALSDDSIAGAAIDVAQNEPLPPQSRLWDLPNLIISPHSAGGRPRGYEELIINNVRAWRNGAELSCIRH